MSVVSAERPKPPRGPLLAIVFTLVVVAVLAATVVILVRYRPVEATGAPVPGRFAVGARDRDRLPTDPVRFRFERGRGTSLGLTLRNGGRLSIKLRDVDLPPTGRILRRTKLVLPAEGQRTVDPEEAASFRAVQLDPGDARFVVLVLRFGERCPRGSTASVGELRVRYSVFGLGKAMDVALPGPIEVPCPARRARDR